MSEPTQTRDRVIQRGTGILFLVGVVLLLAASLAGLVDVLSEGSFLSPTWEAFVVGVACCGGTLTAVMFLFKILWKRVTRRPAP